MHIYGIIFFPINLAIKYVVISYQRHQPFTKYKNNLIIIEKVYLLNIHIISMFCTKFTIVSM